MAVAWALYAGPLAGRLVRMDPVWLETLASKDYLFPLNWPAAAWLVNLGYVPIILWIFQRRRAAGLLVPREGALVAGCLSLVLVFAATLAPNAARVALAIQLQPARIFWMLDFLAVIYVVWAAAEGVGGSGATHARATGPPMRDARAWSRWRSSFSRRRAARTSCWWSFRTAAWRRSLSETMTGGA